MCWARSLPGKAEGLVHSGPPRAPDPPRGQTPCATCHIMQASPSWPQATYPAGPRCRALPYAPPPPPVPVFAQTLLDLGASTDYKDSRGLTPLYHSVMVGGDPYCCELLLHDYAKVGCIDENGWQEIHQVSSVAEPAGAGGGRRGSAGGKGQAPVEAPSALLLWGRGASLREGEPRAESPPWQRKGATGSSFCLSYAPTPTPLWAETL